jgi:hypothetical protein
MRSLDTFTWPARRWLCDRLVGQHAYSRNVAAGPPSGMRWHTEYWNANNATYQHDRLPFVVFDQERI